MTKSVAKADVSRILETSAPIIRILARNRIALATDPASAVLEFPRCVAFSRT